MANETLKTMDYNRFKYLNGNRSVGKRKDNIVKSIKEIGWISNPILVNENMEIIDGQSRYQALIELGMPIEYKVITGLDIADCRAMNKYNSQWTKTDFIESYAAEGNINYIRVKNLRDTFNIKQTRLIMRAAGKQPTKEQIMNGQIIMTDKDYGKAYRRLNLYSKFEKILKTFGGRDITKAPAMFYIADRNDIDIEYMLKVLETCDTNRIYTDNVEHFLESIQKVYNHNRQKKNRIHIAEDYKKEKGL